jgi:hypothetical protein
VSDQVGVIYCGSCGALNPRTNHYCSACGHQLVDAYHASEGLRVYATPDPGAPLVEIVDAGVNLHVVDTDEDLPADFAKVLLEDGRLGYVRLREVEAFAAGDEHDPVRREPVGCISSTALLAIIALLVVSATLILATAVRGSDASNGLIAIFACALFVPFLLVVVGLYLYVRKREDEILAEREPDTDDTIVTQATEPSSN